MTLAPYPDYKDSGQPFLGRVPAHWDVLRNGRLFAQRNENGFGTLPILDVSLKTGVRRAIASEDYDILLDLD